MPKVTIVFTKETFEKLKAYMVKKYGGARALSIVIGQAVKEYLEREEQNR